MAWCYCSMSEFFLNRRIYTCKVQCAQGASYDKSMPKIVIGNKDISMGVLVYFRTEFAILTKLKLICDIFTVFLKNLLRICLWKIFPSNVLKKKLECLQVYFFSSKKWIIFSSRLIFCCDSFDNHGNHISNHFIKFGLWRRTSSPSSYLVYILHQVLQPCRSILFS